MNIIKLLSKKPKYEFMVFEAGMAFNGWKEKLSKLQDDGWEVAGTCSTTKGSEWSSDIYMQIPLKRKI